MGTEIEKGHKNIKVPRKGPHTYGNFDIRQRDKVDQWRM